MLTEHLTLTLNVLCGRVLRPGDTLESGSFLTPGDTRRAQVIPPSDPAPGAPHRVRGLSGMPGEMLTNSLADEILEPGEGQVRALIVSGGNPVVAFPDQAKTEAALRRTRPARRHRPPHDAHRRAGRLRDRPPPRARTGRRAPHHGSAGCRRPTATTPRPCSRTDDDLLTEWEVFAGIAARNGTEIDLPGGPDTPRRRRARRRASTTMRSSTSSTARPGCRWPSCASTAA